MLCGTTLEIDRAALCNDKRESEAKELNGAMLTGKSAVEVKGRWGGYKRRVNRMEDACSDYAACLEANKSAK